MIYADLEFLLEKMQSCQNSLEKSYKEINKTKHTTSGFALFTSCLFDPTKNNFDFYKNKDCMESFCKNLKNMQKQ